MLPPCKLQVSGGFLLLAAWFFLANGWSPLVTVLCAAVVHELGHWVVLQALGAKVTRIRLSALGAVLETDSVCLSYGGELAAVLAGPAGNLLAAILLTTWGQDRFLIAVGANLVLCVFNLLPICPLDGGRALYLLASWLGGPAAGETVVRWVGTVTALVLSAGLGLIIWRSGGSLWLLPALFASVYWGTLPWLSARYP